MNTIVELGHISTYRPASGELLRLFELLNSSPEMTKEIAQLEFKETGKSDTNFRVVYKSLKDKLVNGIFTNSFTDYRKVQQGLFSIYRNFAAAKILILSENKKAALTLMNECYRKARKYGVMDVAESLCRELQNHYGTVEIDRKKYKHFRKEKITLNRLRNEEMEAEEVLFSLVFAIKTQQSLDAVQSELRGLQQINNQEYRFNLYRFTCQVLIDTIQGDATAILATCKEALHFFNSIKTPLPYISKWNFYFRAAPVFIAQGKYSQAQAYLNQSANGPNMGSFNHHLALLYTAVCGFHSGKPKIALEAWKRGKKYRATYDSVVMVERWKVVEAYLHFYAKLGLVQMSGSFRLGKFLNETPKMSLRKPGQNVAILIVQLLHFLMDGKKKAYSHKVDQLNDYIQYHLKGAAYDRCRLMMRLLQQVEFGDYHGKTVARRAEKYLASLETAQISIGVDLLENEVVEYGVLWEDVMGFLLPKYK